MADGLQEISKKNVAKAIKSFLYLMLFKTGEILN